MKNLFRKLTTIFYAKILKPILFLQKPDKVHENLIKLGSFTQKFTVIRWFLSKLWAHQNSTMLAQNLMGIKFKNPVGLSAGFDKNFQLPPLLNAIGFGYMEGGSITYEPCSGNPRPWFYRLPKTKSIVVNAGLPNHGAPVIIERILRYSTKTLRDFPLNISVAKTNSPDAVCDEDAVTDYINSLKLIQKADVGNLVTINISCPNTYGGEPFTTPKKLDLLLSEIDKLKLVKPVLVKMPSDLDWPAFDELLKAVVKHNIKGVTISNLAKNRSKLKLLDPLPDEVKGNLSGKPTWELSNTLIAKTYQKYGDKLLIIGVGGIFNAEDAYTKIKLGASMIELITGMIFEGPQLIGQINHDLCMLLANDGYKNISQAIGVDNK